MKITIIKNDEMIIKKKEYFEMLIKISELKEQASPFHKCSINEIRNFFGLSPIKNKTKN